MAGVVDELSNDFNEPAEVLYRKFLRSNYLSRQIIVKQGRPDSREVLASSVNDSNEHEPHLSLQTLIRQ